MKKSVTILVLSLIILLIFTIQSSAEQKNIYVDSMGQKDYDNIQEAINNASDGDVIKVLNGIYIGDISINKSIKLNGQDKNNTIIKGTITIRSDKVQLSKITINNSNLSKNGINIFANQSVIQKNTISNCNIGINISNFSVNLIYHNNFLNNTKNAVDYGKNTWYNKTLQQGNYWDDYKGDDENLDGIGDKAYIISDRAEVKDKYPLMMRYEEFLKINEQGFELDELSYVLLIGGIISVIVLVPIAYYFRKKILRL